MATITATMVKDLRDKTGAGMMDCKAALAETKGDIEAAVDWLRTKGLAKAAKKAGRVAAEGLIGLAADAKQAALVEVNSETDFVARNEAFQKLASGIAEAALHAKGDLDKLSEAKFPGGDATVADTIKEMVGSIGENMTLRRTAHLTVKNGAVASYMHNAIAPGLGKIGVIVALESTGTPDDVKTFGRQVAMHIAFANPQSLDVDGLDKALVERERAVLTEQAKEFWKTGPGHREDGRGPLAEILRGGRASRAAFRARFRDHRGQGHGSRRQDGRRADQDYWFPPVCLGRGDRPGGNRFRRGGCRGGIAILGWSLCGGRYSARARRPATCAGV